MAAKKTRTRLLVAGAAAAASALAFYFLWKAFKADDDSHTDDEDPQTDDQELRLPCANDAEIQVQTTGEKKGSRIAEDEEESGFNLEEFDQFIVEEYGRVLADFGARESSFKVYEIPVERDLDGFGGYGIARKEEGIQKNIQFCCRSIEGGGGSEGFVGEFSYLSRDVVFDEMSMRDMSEEDGMILGNAHHASESLRELGGQSATDFEFHGGDNSCRGMAVGFDSSGMDGLSRKTSEENLYQEDCDLEKSPDVQISLEEAADGIIINGVEALVSETETSKPSDDIWESSSVKGNKCYDYGMYANSVQFLKEQGFENLESTKSLDCNRSVGQLLKDGILSSNGILENSDGLISNGHFPLKSVGNIVDGSLQNLPLENYTGVNKGSDKLLSDLSQDSKKPDMGVCQQPKFDNIDNNHNGLEDSGSDSDGTQPKSSSGMVCATLSSQAYEEALHTRGIATNEHSALQIGEDLRKQFNGEANLIQTVEETNKSRRADVKFEDDRSHLLSLPHIDCHDKSTEQLLEGSRASSTMNGGSNKHSEGLDAYDAYLADPSLSPSMRSQVARAKAIAQKLYAAKEG